MSSSHDSRSSNAQRVGVSKRDNAISGESSVARFFTSVFPLFPSLEHLATHPEGELSSTVGLLVELCQMLAFTVNIHFPWGYLIDKHVSYVLSFTHAAFLWDPDYLNRSATPISSNTGLAHVVALSCLLFVLLLLVLIMLAHRWFTLSGSSSAADGRLGLVTSIMRVSMRSLSTVLFIPAMQLMIAGLLCRSNGMSATGVLGASSLSGMIAVSASPLLQNSQCWSASHTATFVLSVLSLVFFVPLMFIILTCDVNLQSRSPTVRARSHPLAEHVVFAIKVVFVVVFQVTLTFQQHLVNAVIVALGSLLCVALHCAFLPYYRSLVNRFVIAAYALNAVAAVIAAVSISSSRFTMSVGPAVILLSLAPLVLLLALVFGDFRINDEYLLAIQLAACNSRLPSIISLTPCEGLVASLAFSRFGVVSMDDFVSEGASVGDDEMNSDEGGGAGGEDHHRFRQTKPSHNGGGATTGVSPNSHIDEAGGLLASIRLEESHNTAADDAAADTLLLRDRERVGPVGMSPAPLLSRVVFSTDVELVTRFVPASCNIFNRPPDPYLVYVAFGYFARGLATFPSSVTLFVQFAAFLRYFQPSLGRLGLEVLHDMDHYLPTLPQYFMAHLIGKSLKTAVGIRDQVHAMHVLAATQRHFDTLNHIHAFWSKLTEPSVDVGNVASIAEKICSAKTMATNELLLAVDTQGETDVSLMQRVSRFLNDILLDRDAAIEVMEEAKEIKESRQSRAMKGSRKNQIADVDHAAVASRLRGHLKAGSDRSAAAASAIRGGGADGAGDGGGAGSSLMRGLLVQMSFVFLVLLVIVSVLIATGNSLVEDELALLQQAMAGNAMRTLPSQYMSLTKMQTSGYFSGAALQGLKQQASDVAKEFGDASATFLLASQRLRLSNGIPSTLDRMATATVIAHPEGSSTVASVSRINADNVVVGASNVVASVQQSLALTMSQQPYFATFTGAGNTSSVVTTLAAAQLASSVEQALTSGFNPSLSTASLYVPLRWVLTPFWSLVSEMQSSLDGLSRSNSSTASATTAESAFMNTNVLTEFTSALNGNLQVVQWQFRRLMAVHLSIFVTLSIIGMVVACIALVAFLVSFNSTSMRQTFTFHLFTLIPFDSLERLATNAKDAMDSLERDVIVLKAALEDSGPDDEGSGVVVGEDGARNIKGGAKSGGQLAEESDMFRSTSYIEKNLRRGSWAGHMRNVSRSAAEGTQIRGILKTPSTRATAAASGGQSSPNKSVTITNKVEEFSDGATAEADDGAVDTSTDVWQAGDPADGRDGRGDARRGDAAAGGDRGGSDGGESTDGAHLRSRGGGSSMWFWLPSLLAATALSYVLLLLISAALSFGSLALVFRHATRVAPLEDTLSIFIATQHAASVVRDRYFQTLDATHAFVALGAPTDYDRFREFRQVCEGLLAITRPLYDLPINDVEAVTITALSDRVSRLRALLQDVVDIAAMGHYLVGTWAVPPTADAQQQGEGTASLLAGVTSVPWRYTYNATLYRSQLPWNVSVSAPFTMVRPVTLESVVRRLKRAIELQRSATQQRSSAEADEAYFARVAGALEAVANAFTVPATTSTGASTELRLTAVTFSSQNGSVSVANAALLRDLQRVGQSLLEAARRLLSNSVTRQLTADVHQLLLANVRDTLYGAIRYPSSSSDADTMAAEVDEKSGSVDAASMQGSAQSAAMATRDEAAAGSAASVMSLMQGEYLRSLEPSSTQGTIVSGVEGDEKGGTSTSLSMWAATSSIYQAYVLSVSLSVSLLLLGVSALLNIWLKSTVVMYVANHMSDGGDASTSSSLEFSSSSSMAGSGHAAALRMLLKSSSIVTAAPTTITRTHAALFVGWFIVSLVAAGANSELFRVATRHQDTRQTLYDATFVDAHVPDAVLQYVDAVTAYVSTQGRLLEWHALHECHNRLERQVVRAKMLQQRVASRIPAGSRRATQVGMLLVDTGNRFVQSVATLREWSQVLSALTMTSAAAVATGGQDSLVDASTAFVAPRNVTVVLSDVVGLPAWSVTFPASSIAGVQPEGAMLELLLGTSWNVTSLIDASLGVFGSLHYEGLIVPASLVYGVPALPIASDRIDLAGKSVVTTWPFASFSDNTAAVAATARAESTAGGTPNANEQRLRKAFRLLHSSVFRDATNHTRTAANRMTSILVLEALETHSAQSELHRSWLITCTAVVLAVTLFAAYVALVGLWTLLVWVVRQFRSGGKASGGGGGRMGGLGGEDDDDADGKNAAAAASSASSTTSVINPELYEQQLRRALLSLLAVVLFFGALLGLGVWQLTLSENRFTQLELAGRRELYLSQSVAYLQDAVLIINASGTSSSSAAAAVQEVDWINDARDCASSAAGALDESLMDSFLFMEMRDGSGRIQPNILNGHGSFDDSFVGPKDPNAAFRRLSEAYVMSQCGTLTQPEVSSTAASNSGASATAKSSSDSSSSSSSNGRTVAVPIPAYGSFMAGQRDPQLTDTFAWKQNVTRLVTQRFRPSESLTSMQLTTATSANGMLRSLKESNQYLANEYSAAVQSGRLNFILVASVSLLVICSVYVLVFYPIIRRLADEEANAFQLLQMIPPDVRDQVPAIVEFLERGTIDNAAEMRRKFEMNEKLLQNILPQSISARLKAGESPIADEHPCITILFTDFVGFTNISSSMVAEEVVDFLNEVFVEFDTVTELLALEKIKTIGDAYFMAGGLDPAIVDHAMRVIDASLFFFQILEEHNARHTNRKPLRMRLGVHTGPAVAGVIGTKKVAYDLWGPNVEIANAMESTGVPGKVHISESTLEHVKDYYIVVPRGELPREKGVPAEMPKTFLVMGRALPTPYQHLQRPRLHKAKVVAGSLQQSLAKRKSLLTGGGNGDRK